MRLDNIFKLKCPICGCNNKLFTQRLDDSNKPVGYKLICCGCGNKTVFTTSHMSGADIDTKNAHDGKSICFQPSFCNTFSDTVVVSVFSHQFKVVELTFVQF